MERLGTDSWRVMITNDTFSLNFATYVGFAYGMIANINEIDQAYRWPERISPQDAAIQDEQSLALQWQSWWTALLEQRARQVQQRSHKSHSESFMPPDFASLSDSELRACCQQAWPAFIAWWQMAAGGSMALAWYESRSTMQRRAAIDESANLLGRKVKPFSLHIDLLYSGAQPTIALSPEHIILTRPHLLLHKDWWLERILPIA